MKEFIRMIVEGCEEGICPEYDLIVLPGGKMEFFGQKNVKKRGRAKAKMQQSSWDALTELSLSLGFFTWSLPESSEVIKELTTEQSPGGIDKNENGVTLHVSINDQERRIWHYYPKTDRELDKQLKSIQTKLARIEGYLSRELSQVGWI